MAWNERRYQKPKLRYYNMHKPSLDPEDYLFMNIPKYHRSIFAQFRAGILPLNIEVGRFRNLSLDERVCPVCSSNEVEDEIHFLLQCPTMREYREVLFSKAMSSNPEFGDLDLFDKFNYLVGILQKPTISFLVKAFNKRRDILYNLSS